MRGQSHAGERSIAELAHRQHGVVAERQLRALGLGPGAVQYRLSVGRLHRLHRGVYAVGHARLTARGGWMAGVLAAGDGAVLSHRDAAALWGLMAVGGGRVAVSVRASGRRQRPGIRLHQVRRLHPDDRAVRDGIPVTSVARTLLDLAEVLRPAQLSRVYEEAERLGLLDVRAVQRMCERSPGRRGLKPLMPLIADRTRYAPQTRRELEALFFEFCRDQGLPLPAFNVLVEGYVVDALWPDRRLIVELDGWEFHRGREAFERDRERDAALQAAGYRVIRITWRRLANDPANLATLLRSLL